MKKRICAFLFIFILCFSTVFTASATEGFADEFYRVVDMADLLSDSEEAALNEKLDEISIRQSMDVIVATTDDLMGYSVYDFADTLYEECSFGYGSNRDGLLLLISIVDNDWYISTSGYGITAFTDAGIEYIGEKITPALSDGDYAGAFTGYAELCDEFITQARTGEPYDSWNLPREPLSLIWIPIAIVIGFALSKIVVGSMKSKLKTVHMQTTANSYIKSGSMNITEQRDLFLYHTVTRTARANNSSSGSSTHRSSSGNIHGGGGGKF